MDFALDRHDVIRPDGKFRALEAFHEAGQVAPGIDYPGHAARLQTCDKILQFMRDGRAFKLGMEGPVKVCGQKMDWQFH
jgi:hypothetical protein